MINDRNPQEITLPEDLGSLEQIIRKIERLEASSDPASLFEMTTDELLSLSATETFPSNQFQNLTKKIFVLFSEQHKRQLTSDDEKLLAALFGKYNVEEKLQFPLGLNSFHHAARSQNFYLLDYLLNVIYPKKAEAERLVKQRDANKMTSLHHAAWSANEFNYLNRDFFSLLIKSAGPSFADWNSFIELQSQSGCTAANILADSEDSTLLEEYQELVGQITNSQP